MNVHPAAAVFPMLPDDELAALADDIAANGLIHPIVTTPDGDVLDGRNRLAACELAGIAPHFITHDGDPIAFVLSANVARRHMTTGARAMATAVVLVADGKRRDGRWAYGALANSEESNNSTWRVAMAQAGVVLDVTPEAAPAVIAGAVSLTGAVHFALRARSEAQSVEVRFARLPPDLAESVRDETLTLSEAEAAHRQRQADHADAVRRHTAYLQEFVTTVASRFDAIVGGSFPYLAEARDALGATDRQLLDDFIERSRAWTT
jgi:hypothetical protein